MAELTYHSFVVGDGKGIDQHKLKHHYYAQQPANNNQLVPGVLFKGRPSAPGRWVDVGSVNKHFSERYFVQYTGFNTLVQGSLVKGSRLPEGKWKEVKLNGPEIPFHRISLAAPYFSVGGSGEFASNYNFLPDVMIPAIELVYPGIVIDISHEKYADFYSFRGDFNELISDTGQMKTFTSVNDVYLTYLFVGSETPGMNTTERGSINFNMGFSAPDGLYSFIMGVYNDENTIVDYIVLENILGKNVPV